MNSADASHTDPIRLLAVLEHFGEQDSDRPETPFRAIRGERSARSLDHLVGDAAALMCAALDIAGSIRHQPTLRDRLRNERDGAVSLRSVRPSSASWDDDISRLSCRDLIRVRPLADEPDRLEFALTSSGKKFLDALPTEQCAVSRRRCRLIDELFGDFAVSSRFPDFLRQADERLVTFRTARGLSRGDDIVSARFLAVFGRPL